MNKGILAIYDMETAYVYSLMECMHARAGVEFEVQAFTNLHALMEFTRGHSIEMLLIASVMMNEQIKKLDIGKIMILSEGEQISELSDYPMVYKYQAVDNLIREVMDFYARVRAPSKVSLLKPEVEVIGVFSPIGRCGKTGFAMTLGQILCKNRNVLYLNLEECAGFEQLMKREYKADISDLMYFAGQGGGNLMCKLVGIVQSFHNLDYIPPAFSPFDLRSISIQEWLSLMKYLSMYSTYETVLIDLGETVDSYPEILRQCGKIYTPYLEDVISAAKMAQYEKVLMAAGYEDVLEKTKKLVLPETEPDYAGQMIWGKMADFVRKLLEEEHGKI